MSSIFLWLGYALCFLGGIWIIVLAWQKGILWGLACLFIPVVQFIYVALNWKESKSAFFLLVAGIAALFLSGLLGH